MKYIVSVLGKHSGKVYEAPPDEASYAALRYIRNFPESVKHGDKIYVVAIRNNAEDDDDLCDSAQFEVIVPLPQFTLRPVDP